MNGTSARITAITVSAVMLFTAGSCGKITSDNNKITQTNSSLSPTTETYEPLDQPQVQILITLSALVPEVQTVRPGTKVTWLNGLEGEIQLVSDQGLFGGWVDDRGSAYSFTFIKPGEYAYEIYGIQQYTGLIIVLP